MGETQDYLSKINAMKSVVKVLKTMQETSKIYELGIDKGLYTIQEKIEADLQYFASFYNAEITKEIERKKEELQKLENKQFMLAMQDTWDSNDYKFDGELHEKIKKLKEELEGAVKDG